MQFLAYNNDYELYSCSENVYLKDRHSQNYKKDYSIEDIWVACIYGNPTGALIIDDMVVISGTGITLFDITTKTETYLMSEPNNIIWSWGLHQFIHGYSGDDLSTQIRFFSYDDTDGYLLYRYDIKTNISEILSKMSFNEDNKEEKNAHLNER